jgi:type II secretory pathway pseudopilin PulG
MEEFMTNHPPARRRIKESEQGYVLLIAVFFMALLVIAMAAAAPLVVKSIQRDREVETFHRGMQYRRGIQLYYRKFNAYPPSIDALTKTNNIRFLRKRYIDPMTGKDDWKPVRFGQNKTPTAMGFFGEPLAGNASTIAGTGPSGGNGLNGTSGSSSGSGVGDMTSTLNSSGSTGSTGATGGTGSTSDSSSNSSTGLTGQTFGGAGIIGFSPASPKQSILVYKKKNHYNEWEFTYDPLQERKVISSSTGALNSSNSNSNALSNSTFGSSSPTSTSSSTSGSQ